MKPRIRIRKDKNVRNCWHSSNWTSSKASYPAFHVQPKLLDESDIQISLDFFNGGSLSWMEKNTDPKLVCQFIGKLVNKYFSDGIPIDLTIRDEIIVAVKRYIQKTRDIFEPL